MAMGTYVVCQECGTPLGGDTGKDTYSHMLHCLNVDPDALTRIRENAEGAKSENGRRVMHLVDAMLSGDEQVGKGDN